MADYKLAYTKVEKDVEPSGLKYTEIPKMTFEVKVGFDDKIYKEIQSDGILLEEMKEAVDKIYKQTCDGIKGKYAAFDKMFVICIEKGGGKSDIDKHLDGLNKSVRSDLDVAESVAEPAVEMVWKKYQKTKKDYLKYKIKIGCSITSASAGLLTGIVLTATTPFTGGASAAFGIIGMAKAAVTIARTIRSAWSDIETAQKRLASDLDALGKIQAKIGVKANEYSAVVLKQFLDLSQPSIKSCGSQMEIIEKKLGGIEINTHEASKTLNTMLNEIGTVKKDFMAEVKKRYQKMVGQIPSGQINDIETTLDLELSKAEKKINEQIKHVQSMYADFKDAEKNTEVMKKKFEPFEDGRTIDIKRFELLMVFIDLPLAIFDGNKIARAGDLEAGLGEVAVFLMFDKLVERALKEKLII